MLRATQMILIGSSGQNAGKTSLAKAFINQWKGMFPIAALKITSVAHHGAVCPRGGQGCGACVAVGETDFVLEEELGESPAKDTARLLHAGADRVFWLRCLYGALAAGYGAFLEKIPPKALILCESNSLREVVLPGCFIMVINSNKPAMKPTAARVLPMADIVAYNTKTPEDLVRIVSRLQVEQDETGAIHITAH
jgi:hypothetical protein